MEKESLKNKKIPFKNAKQIAEEAFIWCVKKFGSPIKTKEVPELIVSYERSSDCYGYYVSATKEIVVFPFEIPSKTMLVRVLIHEYTHFLQMPKVRDHSKYNKLNKMYGYDGNPLEVEAYQAELKYYRSCYSHLKKMGVV